MLNTETGWTFMDKEVGGRVSNRDMGQHCGKTMILLRKKNLNGFGGLGWSRSLETVKKRMGNAFLRPHRSW